MLISDEGWGGLRIRIGGKRTRCEDEKCEGEGVEKVAHGVFAWRF
jgi:hypothetical protein